MKTFFALSLLATLGLIAVGCGASRKAAVPNNGFQFPTTTVPGGTTTIPSALTGSLIVCKTGPRTQVPPAGKEVTDILDGSGKSAGMIQLTHARDSSVKVVCRG